MPTPETSTTGAPAAAAARLPEEGHYLDRVGATPLVPVRLAPGDPAVWCKLEFLNPSGSTKDRIAHYILGKALRDGTIPPGGTVVEASSGSTSIAMALAAAQMGLRFVAVMPEGVSRERRLIIEAFGARVVLTPRAGGVAGALAEAAHLARAEGAFAPCQFTNPDNAAAHRHGTAREIIAQIPGGSVDAVASGVGTGGTLVGLCRGFADFGCRPEAVAARPTSGHAVAGGGAECCSFSGRIPGVVDGLSGLYAEFRRGPVVEVDVPDDEALALARRLIRLGFPVGPSSGLNLHAALATARRLGPDARVVTIFPDRMERYFSTELFDDMNS